MSLSSSMKAVPLIRLVRSGIDFTSMFRSVSKSAISCRRCLEADGNANRTVPIQLHLIASFLRL